MGFPLFCENVATARRHLAKSSLDEAERYLHEVAGEVLNQARVDE